MASPADDTQQINFDLDAERPAASKAPFRIKATNTDGVERVVELIDPQMMDWKIAMSIDNPRQFLASAWAPEDRLFMRKVDFPVKVLELLIESYMRYFGLDNLPNGGASAF